MIRIRQVKVPLDDRKNITKYIEKKLKTKINNYKIIKESIDARRKPDIYLIYEVDVSLNNEDKYIDNKDIIKTPDETFKFDITGTIKLNNNITIIGAGPAGLFCGYILSSYGYKVTIIERGDTIENRVDKINEFWETGKLDINSNVQFGLGGAGTFSDGKLNTLTKDPEFISKKVFEIFVENGAPSEIMYKNKPHIGTDNLRIVINNMYHKMLSMGVEFKFNSVMTNIIVNNNSISKIIINNSEEIETEVLVLAIGHSARDTFKMLYENNMVMESKPFAVGLRVEHNQKNINMSQYGMEYHPYLGNATYKLAYTTKAKRGVYSFCMCPGGYVVNASSEEGMLVVNGMSNYGRDTNNANSAIVVTVSKDDFGSNPLDGVEFQRKLEKSAYQLGNGNIPIQKYIDFKNNNRTINLGNVENITKGKVSFANLNEILPLYISDSIKEAMPIFGNKIKGFDNDDVILSGIESRTSSPVKIVRDESYESSIKGIYPCGEGAGYAGGITTSAMDGIKVAKMIVKKYRN